MLAELADRVHAAHSGALVISEMCLPDFRPLRDWGHDAMWLDSLHHALHVALTGEQDGYYADFDGSMSRLAAELSRPEGSRIVACAQNHDQVGNRALGDRLPPPSGAWLRLSSSSASTRRSSSRARSTARPPRSSTSPTTSIRSSPMRHARAGGASSPTSPASRARCPTRRTRRRSSGPGSTPAEAGGALRSPAPAAARATARAGDRGGRGARTLELRRGRAHCTPTSPTRPWSSRREALARASVPARPTWDGEGTNFSLFSEHAEKVELCLFDEEDRETRYELTERTAFNWHGYSPESGRGSGTASASTGAGRRSRPPLQPEQAPARPVREVDRGADPLGPRQHASLRPERRGRRSRARRRGRLRRDPEVDRDRRRLRLAGRPAPAAALARDRDLRAAHEGVHEADGRRARGAARHLRRARIGAGARVPRLLGITAVELLPIHHIADEHQLVQRACRTTGATARSATSRRTRSTRRPAGAGSR